MNRFLRLRAWRLGLLLNAMLVANPPVSMARVRLDTLGKYLTTKGYGGAQLVHSGKFYHLPIRSNGQPGHLVIDPGTPSTLIFRSSVRYLGLTETRTNVPVRSILGPSTERYGLSRIRSFQAGNFTVKNVPVAIAPDLGGSSSYGRPNGLLGLGELMKFGAILDFSNRILYLRPSRPGREVADEMRSILARRGWKPITMTYTRWRMRVPGEANDVPCHFLVDTGTFLTALDRSFTNRARVPTREIDSTVHGVGRSSRSVELATLESLSVGNYQVQDALAAVLSMDSRMLFRGTQSEAAGLLGVEYLARNSAVFDFVSGTLYLKPRVRR